MSYRILIVATALCATLLTGCKKKTAAETAEEDRLKLREEKRAKAIEAYKALSEKFPEHPKAKAAASEAQSLAAQGKK